MVKVFVDGSAGTTGLRIKERLSGRDDVELLILPEELRKDLSARKEALNSADVVFLCLPDVASIEAVSMIKNKSVAVIDTSTAFRTDGGWVYGFPEISNNRELIRTSKRIANPGCHASGFIALIQPLVENKLIDGTEKLTCFSLTGYTGGGKKMIEEYVSPCRSELLSAPRQYALGQQHKHLKEMAHVTGLENKPCFCPIVAPFDCGMEVTVPLFKSQLKGSMDDVIEIYKNKYTDGVVKFVNDDEGGFLSACSRKGKDDMTLSVYGNEERILLVSRFDNLGKGASGSAIQNMNVLLGINETKGLNI